MKMRLMEKKVLTVLLMFASVVFISCQQPEAFGTLAVSMADQGSKSLRPEGLDVTWVRISGTCNGGAFEPQDFALGDTIAINGLSVGTWLFKVVGYHGDPGNGGQLLTEVAENEVTIQSGKTTESTFIMYYLKTGTGTAQVTATWPSASANFTKVSMILQEEGALAVKNEATTFTTVGENTQATVPFLGMELGNYNLDLVLTNPSGTTIMFPLFDMVSIFCDLTTDGTVSLQAEDLEKVSPPLITILATKGGKSVTLVTSEAEASVYYTTDGSDPATSSTRITYTESFTLVKSATVKAIGLRQGFVDSNVASESVTVEQVATPAISPAGGLFSVSQQVTMSCATDSAVIHYTTDGTTPTVSRPVYNGALTLNSTATVKAIAVKSGMVDSLSSSQSYTLMGTVATPTITNTDATGGQQVSITSGTTGAIIYYTLDGTAPTVSSTKYTASFKLTEAKTVKAIAIKTGMLDSAIATKSVIQVVAPVITSSGVAGGQQVSITSTTSGATIYYTLDGTAPTVSSTKYTASFKLITSKTVKAIAIKTGMLDSAVATKSVIQVVAPVITSSGVAGGQQVSITSTTSGATIYYTLDGTAPTVSSTKYTASFKLITSKTVKAIAIKTGMLDSAIATKSVIQVVAPVITSSGVAGGQQVSITSTTSGATIYYTLDGTAPTVSSTKYTASFKLTTSKTVKAIAIKTGMLDSAVGSKSVTVSKVATPVISPSTTSFSGTVSVTISCSTSGALIYYTINGSNPTTTSTLYRSPFTINATTTVKTMAVKSGMVNSAIASKQYTLQQVYTVGSTGPAGGKIFYVNDNPAITTWKYLEAALTDEASTYIFGGYGTLIGATGTAIGTGQANTTTIMNAPSATTKASYAAKVCEDKSVTYNGKTYADWFLPSKDELNEMYINKATIGGFIDSYYWSSTEGNDIGSAWVQYFVSGVQFSCGKGSTCRVRPVRAFL